MHELVQRIREQGVYLGGGIIKVDAFLNHQIDPGFMARMGQSFADGLQAAGVQNLTRVLTVESSGIGPALMTGLALQIPVVYARKKPPLTMSNHVYAAEAPSRTKGGVVKLMVSPLYLSNQDRVVIIDDFLATGYTILALLEIIQQSGATLCGVGCVVEKVFEPGRERLAERFNGPILSLAKVDIQENELVVTD